MGKKRHRLISCRRQSGMGRSPPLRVYDLGAHYLVDELAVVAGQNPDDDVNIRGPPAFPSRKSTTILTAQRWTGGAFFCPIEKKNDVRLHQQVHGP